MNEIDDFHTDEVNYSDALMECTLRGNDQVIANVMSYNHIRLMNLLKYNHRNENKGEICGADMVTIAKTAYHWSTVFVYNNVTTISDGGPISDLVYYPYPGTKASPLIFCFISQAGATGQSALECASQNYESGRYKEYVNSISGRKILVGVAYDTETGMYSCLTKTI